MIEGCLKHGVQRLMFCSTVDVVIGYQDIIDGDEAGTGKPTRFLMPGYPETKYNAECMVVEVNGKMSQKGTSAVLLYNSLSENKIGINN